jgi:hypothetical protein
MTGNQSFSPEESNKLLRETDQHFRTGYYFRAILFFNGANWASFKSGRVRESTTSASRQCQGMFSVGRQKGKVFKCRGKVVPVPEEPNLTLTHTFLVPCS